MQGNIPAPWILWAWQLANFLGVKYITPLESMVQLAHLVSRGTRHWFLTMVYTMGHSFFLCLWKYHPKLYPIGNPELWLIPCWFQGVFFGCVFTKRFSRRNVETWNSQRTYGAHKRFLPHLSNLCQSCISSLNTSKEWYPIYAKVWFLIPVICPIRVKVGSFLIPVH